MRGQGDEEQWSKIAPSLPGLANGECWWWIPEKGILERVQVRKTRTFDSSPTRTRGHSHRVPKTFAEVDLEAIRGRIAATIERAKASDPRDLTRRIRELEKALESSTHSRPAAEPEIVEVPVLNTELVSRLESIVRSMGEAREALDSAHSDILRHLQQAVNETQHHTQQMADSIDAITAALAHAKEPQPTAATPPPPTAATPVPLEKQEHPSTEGIPPSELHDDAPAGDATVSPARQRLLDALAALDNIGVTPARKAQLALWAGVSPKSSGFANNLGALRTAGLIDYPKPNHVALTPAGHQLTGPVTALTSNDELHRKVQSLVGPMRWRILAALIEQHPQPMSKDALAVAAEVSAKSSGYANNLGALRSLGLLDYPKPGYVGATDVIFLEGS